MNISRRWFITVSGTAAATALAGCSSQDNSSSTEGNPQPESTPKTTTSGQEETVTEEQTEPGQEQQLYEQNESDAEVEYENILSSFSPTWIEMENPKEQFPEENFDTERFPSLLLFTGEGSDGDPVNPYNPEEALYLGVEEQGAQTVLKAEVVSNYENQELRESGNSYAFTREDADVVGIFEEVVEGYDDVAENMSEEYIEALQS